MRPPVGGAVGGWQENYAEDELREAVDEIARRLGRFQELASTKGAGSDATMAAWAAFCSAVLQGPRDGLAAV